MLAYPLALTALLAGSATAVSRTTKQEFIRTMSSQKNLDRKLMADVAKTSRSLTKSIKQNAIMVPPGRKLEDAANANQNQYNQNQYNQNQYNQNQKYYSANYVQGTDDAFANADWENSWGFDASQYSLSYERCATVKHFDLDKAAQEDSTSPFRTQHFAVLRLCPTKTCDTPDWYLQDDAGYEAEAEEQQQQEEQTETYGANGRGCQSNYATFLLDAGKYLEIMADYEDTQFEMYCGYCEHYMQSQYNKWVSGHRDLEFEEFKNDPHRMLGNEWNACSKYSKACNSGFSDDYSDYLNCAQVQKDNGMVAYTQATCAEDGETITIGLYSDEYCSEDITSSSNIANWIGEYVDDEQMAHYYKKVNAGLGELIASYGGKTNVNPNSVCMPCAAENQAWFLNDDAVSNQGEIAEVCDNVFLQSARCDKTLSNWWQHKRNPKYADSVALQEVSCSYIDSMKMGKYDTSGNVVMDNNRLYNEGEAKGLSGNVYFQEYGQGIAEVSPLQIALLVLSIMACVILALWSTTLHKSLTKGGYKWKPSGRRGVGAGADDIPRQDSGIVVGRSQSNHSSYYMG